MTDSARVTVVVDAANCVGSVPDGWWRDRAGATRRLRDSISPDDLCRALDQGEDAVVVTADRGLRARVASLGARTVGPRVVRSRETFTR